jgi:hypothetical protein
MNRAMAQVRGEDPARVQWGAPVINMQRKRASVLKGSGDPEADQRAIFLMESEMQGGGMHHAGGSGSYGMTDPRGGMRRLATAADLDAELGGGDGAAVAAPAKPAVATPAKPQASGAARRAAAGYVPGFSPRRDRAQGYESFQPVQSFRR